MRRRGALASLAGRLGREWDDGIELSPIKAIELAAARLPDVISLAQGIPSFDTPEPIKRYVTEKIAEGVCAKYSLTPGLPQLREMIAESLRADGMTYDPDGEILVTCGAIEAISATLLSHVEPGDEVIVASPTYASYLPAIRIAGAEPRFVPLNEDANFDLDPEAIGRAIRRSTRAILLSNPNNPTGTIYSQAEMGRLLELAERHDLLVITDEVYKDFLYTDEPVGNPARDPRYRHRVVRVCSFSKAYGMTGWRVGFLHTDRPVASRILEVHDALVTCAPVVSQYAAIAALEWGEPWVARFREAFRERRQRILHRLEALPEVFDYQPPNASYFVFPRVKDRVPLARDSRALATDILERARVALVPGVAFGPSGEAHLRFCYAREASDIDGAFDRLQDYFQGRRPRTWSLPGGGGEAGAAPGAVGLPASWRRRLGVGALQGLARLYLRRRRPRVVAIAGGAGKTGLKRRLLELLGQRWRVRGNPLSYNTDAGLAFGILGTPFDTRRPSEVIVGLARSVGQVLWPDDVEILVLELGTRQPGDMARLLRVVQPDLAVLTGTASGGIDDAETAPVLREELQTLATAMAAAGRILLLPADDSLLAGISGPGVRPFRDGLLREEGGGRWLDTEAGSFPLRGELLGSTDRRTLAAAITVAKELGLPPAAIEAWLCR